jgi:hypothetical protein
VRETAWSGLTFDQDAMLAAIDLARRSGAKDIEIGYLHDDVPVEQAGWYASARYRGAKLIIENKPGPVEASEGLARRILAGATCAHCAKPVALSGEDPGTCRWTRIGARWKRGCE